MQKTQVQFLDWEDPLEKGKATHSSILAWRIPGTVQSMGSQRVGHNWANFTMYVKGFSGSSVVKNPSVNAGDAGDRGCIPGSGSSPGEGNGNPVQYSHLENSMDREVWQATVHGITKSQTWLSHRALTGRCKSLGSLKSFFPCASQLLGPVSCVSFLRVYCRGGEGCSQMAAW